MIMNVDNVKLDYGLILLDMSDKIDITGIFILNIKQNVTDKNK